MATAPQSRRLNLTRDQLAEFLTDQQQIRQFELLFSTVDELQVIVGTDFEFQADTAAATANEALAQIAALAQTLELQTRPELGTLSPQNADRVAITGGTINGTTIGATNPANGRFTEVAVTTATGDSTFSENDTITGWIYSGDSFSVAAQETAPNGLFIGSAGTKMYVNGTSGDDVNEYTLSTAWDITTATFVTTFSTAPQDTTPQDIFFKPDGLSMFVIGSISDAVFQYTLSTAWDVSTASYAGISFSVAAQDTAPLGLWFRPNGLIMYVVGSTSDTVFQYTLSTAWDVSTASYSGISYSVAAQDTTPVQINLSEDGLKMWMLGSNTDAIWEYDLGTAWNVSTATLFNNFYIGFQETSPSGMFIDSTAPNRVYIVGSTTDTVFQYYTENNSLKLDADNLVVNGELRVENAFSVKSNAFVEGSLGVQGATQLSTTSISGTLTSTSTTTLATSTSSQTVALGAGATASGSTKAINIGTAGVSGSTTNIAIGSAVSGATSSTTLNGLVIDSISAAISAAGVTQGTATALVSNINNVTVVTAAASGVRLPTAVAGMRILVRNSDAADTLNIFPATGGTINALAVNASFSLAIGTTVELMATTATQWYTF
jgi:hypothetical protein